MRKAIVFLILVTLIQYFACGCKVYKVNAVTGEKTKTKNAVHMEKVMGKYYNVGKGSFVKIDNEKEN